MTHNFSIENLWDKFRNGDDDAFKKLYQTFSESLYQYGLKFYPDEELVKDCIQDLFIKIFQNRKSLSTTDNPRLYLFRALRNLMIDHLKTNKLLYKPEDELPFNTQYIVYPEEGESDDEIERSEKLKQVIENLHHRQKEAIYLRFQKEMSYDEISDTMGINYQSVRNLIYRALEKLRSDWEKNSLQFFLFILQKSEIHEYKF